VGLHLAERAIESRPIWKPMHAQPVFADNVAFVTGVADRLFDEVLCLPSGVGLSDSDIARVIAGVRAALVGDSRGGA
jgi:dTDP-4-amino-4,6-dideoxygalactose transaminase